MRRNIIFSGFIAIFLMILYPPWKGAMYAILFFPPADTAVIDFSRLAIQIFLVVFACGILIYADNNSVKEVEFIGEKSKSLSARRSPIVLAAAVLFLAVSGGIGWNFYSKYSEEKRLEVIQAEERNKKKFLEEKQALAMQSLQRQAMHDEETTKQMALQQEEEERTRIDLQKQEEQRASQHAAAIVAANERAQQLQLQQKISSLSRPRVWLIRESLGSGIRSTLTTSWKSNSAIINFRIDGSPEALEYMLDAHPNFSLSAINRDGLAIARFDLSSSELKSIKSAKGALTSMQSTNKAYDCSMDIYENIAAVRLE